MTACHWCMLITRAMQEDIRDLLAPDLAASPGVHIREVGGSICLAGAHETEVGSRDEMATLLDQVQHPIKPAPNRLSMKQQVSVPSPAVSAPGRMYQEECVLSGAEAMLTNGMQKLVNDLKTTVYTWYLSFAQPGA